MEITINELHSSLKNKINKIDQIETNVNNISLTWDKITGKPSTFEPSEHNHNNTYYIKSEIDTKLDGKSNTNHSHTWENITDKPSSFTPATHNHSNYENVFTNKNLNPANMDKLRGNWIAGYSSINGNYTPALSSHHNIIQFDSQHFLSQIAMYSELRTSGKCVPPTDLFIRSRYNHDNASYSNWVQMCAYGAQLKSFIEDSAFSTTDYVSNLNKIVMNCPLRCNIKEYISTTIYPNLFKSIIAKYKADGAYLLNEAEIIELEINMGAHRQHSHIFTFRQNQTFKEYKCIVDRNVEICEVSKLSEVGRQITFSTSEPSGGKHGDIWYQY